MCVRVCFMCTAVSMYLVILCIEYLYTMICVIHIMYDIYYIMYNMYNTLCIYIIYCVQCVIYRLMVIITNERKIDTTLNK